jgi:hypothetical protein
MVYYFFGAKRPSWLLCLFQSRFKVVFQAFFAASAIIVTLKPLYASAPSTLCFSSCI